MALFLFAHLCFTNPLHVSKAAEVFGNDEIPQQRSGQRSLLDTPSGVSLRNVARGRLDLPDVPDMEKRPFRLATYYRFRPEDSQALIDVVQDELLPTVATLLSRWLRVRLCEHNWTSETHATSTVEARICSKLIQNPSTT